MRHHCRMWHDDWSTWVSAKRSMKKLDSDLDSDILTSPVDALSVGLALVLGLVALCVAIVAAVTGITALTLLSGLVALALAVSTAWLVNVRRKLTNTVREREADVIRLESALGEQVKARMEADERSVHAAERDDPVQSGMHELVGPDGDESELTDPLTGLLGEKYFAVNLDGRVAAARRHLRPLSLILLDVIEGLKKGDANNIPDNANPLVVADIITSTLRDADTVCRLADGRFALILEDTPENGAIWTVERIRRRVNESLTDTTVWAGVACYPAHGFDGPEVLAQARKAVTSARDWHQDRTEVADT